MPGNPWRPPPPKHGASIKPYRPGAKDADRPRPPAGPPPKAEPSPAKAAPKAQKRVIAPVGGQRKASRTAWAEEDEEEDAVEEDEEDEGAVTSCGRSSTAKNVGSRGNAGAPQWSAEERKAWWKEQQAQKQAQLEMQRRKVEEQREERRLAAKKREQTQVLMKKLNDKVQAEDIDASIVVVRELKEADMRPAPATLQRLLEVAARRGSQSEFARSLVVSSECGLKVDAVFFVKIVMSMVQRGCPQIMLRIALNMPLPAEAPVVPLLPPQMDDEEETQAFEDGEPLLDDEKEIKKNESKQKEASPADSLDIPMAMVLVSCEARPELNGPYVFTDSFKEYLEHDRPTFRKGDNDYYVYFWQTDAEGELSGWCVGDEVGSEDMLAYHPDTESWVPPKTGWKFMRAGAEELTAEAGGFVPPEEAPKETEDPWPAELVFSGGAPDEAVSGTYKKTTEYGEYLEHRRPVYVKAGSPTLYVYFWCDEPDKPWKSGWWIGQEVGGDLVCGYNPGQSWVPPFQGWQINKVSDDGECQRRPHPGGFYHKPPEVEQKDDDRFKSLEEVVRNIDLKALQGMVQFPDSRAQGYFGHFCVLLHLEYLKELGQVRRRLKQQDRDRLVRFGWALDAMAVRAIFGQRWKGRYGALPGKATTGSEQVAFGLPSDFDGEKCRIRRGDSVMISPGGCDSPLLDKVGEGIVQDLNDWEMVIALEGHMPDDARKRSWRLDKSANNTAHERQLHALLKLARSGMDKNFNKASWSQEAGTRDHGAAVNALLLAAPVGLVDEWAVQMKERVEQMQTEKLKEKGLEAPEDTEEAWEKWLSTDVGGYVKQALESEIKAAEAAVKAAKSSKVASGDAKQKDANDESAMTIADLAAQGPPVDENSLKAARKSISRSRDLNVSQRRAINATLARRCTVIQGPPGTGKTHVSVKVLSLFARELGLTPLLATSDSNVAVDNICQGLIEDGIKAIRVGRPEKVRSHLEEVTLEAALKRKKESLKKEAIEAERKVKQVEAEAEAARKAAEDEKKAADAKKKLEEEKKAEAEKKAAEAKRKLEEEKTAEAEKKAELEKKAAEAKKKFEDAKKADAEKKASTSGAAEEPPQKKLKTSEAQDTSKSAAKEAPKVESSKPAPKAAQNGDEEAAEPPKKKLKEEEKKETPKDEDKMSWLRKLLARAEISEHFEKAREWAEEEGCVESDIKNGDGVEELIEHLKLKKFAVNRLMKAITALKDGTLCGDASGAQESSASEVKVEKKEADEAKNESPKLEVKEEAAAEAVKEESEDDKDKVKTEPMDEAAREAMEMLEQERREREEVIAEKKMAEEAMEMLEQERKEREETIAEKKKAEEAKLAAEEAEKAKLAAEEARMEKEKKTKEDEKVDAEKEAQKKTIEDEKAKKEAKEAEEAAAEAEKRRLAAEAKAQEQAIIKRQEVRKKQRMEDWELQMDLMNECEVICTTTISAGSDFLNQFQFEAILVDEAAQATELSTIVPIVMRGANRLIIVGDHCQLPPAIMSLEAETRGLSVSMYSRLVGCGIEPHFLNTQYRSHPKIAEFSAAAFYGSLLKSGIDPGQRLLPKGFEWPNKEVPVCFVEVPERERREGDSKINPAEAARVLEIVRAILSAGELNILDIGVVTPYMAQVRHLRQQLRQALPNLLRRLWQSDWEGSWQKYDSKFLEIGSVDAYQGREKELIVFSAVRSNAHGKVGFLADWRRLNVMLTRARRGLIVVGHAETLRYDPCWQQWLEWCEDNDCILKFGSAGAGAGVLLPGTATQAQFNQRLGKVGGGKGKKNWGGGGGWRQGGDGKPWQKGGGR